MLWDTIFTYLFDDENAKLYLSNEISKITEHPLKTLTDYSFDQRGKQLILQELIKNNLFLFNFEEKIEEYKIYLKEMLSKRWNKEIELQEGYAERWALVEFRDYSPLEINFHCILVTGEYSLNRKIRECLPDLLSTCMPVFVERENEYNKPGFQLTRLRKDKK